MSKECKWCPGQLDSVHHRVYSCSHSEAQWSQLPEMVLTEARRAPEDDPLFTRGICASPAKLISKPPADMVIEEVGEIREIGSGR